mgnify:CR=1 FL=1
MQELRQKSIILYIDLIKNFEYLFGKWSHYYLALFIKQNKEEYL